MDEKLKKLSILNEYLYSKLPNDFSSKEVLKSWLKSSPYSPYITLYGGINSKKYNENESFISSVDNKKRFKINDLISFKFENFINFQNNIYSGNSRIYNLINATELFENYPEFRDIELNINISNANNEYLSGSTYHENSEANKIDIYASSNEEAMIVLVHELQHCIQLKEGFEIGESYYQTDGVMDMFVGSIPNEHGNYEIGSFSDIATQKTMKEIDDGNSKIDSTPYLNMVSIFNKKIEDKIDKIYSRYENGELNIEEYTELENKYLDEMLSNRIEGTFKLNRIFKHDTLFQIYPQLKDIDVEFTSKLVEEKAAFNSSKNHILINNKYALEDMKNSLLHEIQHVIQDIEYWAKGGNIKEFEHNLDEYTIDLMLKNLGEAIFLKELSEKNGIKIDDINFKDGSYGFDVLQNKNAIRIAKNNSLDWMKKEYDNYSSNSISKYLTLWGEQQARAVQYRMNMSPEDRINESWTETLEKVEGKYNEPIIKYDTGVSFCIDKQDRKENFKNWFSNSKVVDENGEPLVVYHGTGASFDAFNKSKIGKNYKADDYGFFFSSSASEASEYGEGYVEYHKEGNSNVIPVFLNLKNPYIEEALYCNAHQAYDLRDRIKFDALQSKGFDGVIIKNIKANEEQLKESWKGANDGGDLYMVFEPTQIKSIHNKGTFDPNNPNILEKNDYRLRHIEKVLSIIPDKINTSTVNKYLEFNGINIQNLKNTKYETILEKDIFDSSIIKLDAKIDTNSSYWKNAGEIESREIEDLYKNQDLDEAIKLVNKYTEEKIYLKI